MYILILKRIGIKQILSMIFLDLDVLVACPDWRIS